MTRTDLHRPSVLVPADYSFVTTFAQPRFDLDGECVEEGFGFVEISDFLNANPGIEVFGNDTRCGSCGARFMQGALFQHTSGQALFVGRDCAESMDVLADWSRVEIAAAKASQGRKLALLRQKKAQQIAEIFAAHEGLEDALTTDHYIIRDIKHKLSQYGNLSPAQIALVFKIADEAAKGMVEVNIPAPTGRVTFTGKIVAIKYQQPYCYGAVGTYKATIKVEVEPRKVWLVWVTVPSASEWEKGDTVTVTATLEVGESAHFAFGKRPKELHHLPALVAA